MVEIKFFND